MGLYLLGKVMSRILNIRVEEGATFSKALTFTRTVAQGEDTHPITGRVTKRKVREVLPLTGYTFFAQIKDSFDNPTFIEPMEVRVLDGSQGLVSLALTKEQTSRLAQSATFGRTGIASSRTFKIGFFDVFAINSQGASTKIFYGEVTLTRSATRDPRNTINIPNAFYQSPILPISETIELAVDRTAGQNFVGIRYYIGGVQVTPTGGTVNIFRKPTTSNSFQGTAVASLNATIPTDEALVAGNTVAFQAVPNNLQGADSFQLVVSSNRS